MTTNKFTPLILGAVVVLISATTAFAQNSYRLSHPTKKPAAAASSYGSQSPTYTLADIATHSSRSDCWTSINGGVYNVTSWISQHPGGAEAIISLCGIDGSAAFNGQHGGERRPATELASFKIGTLAGEI